MKKIIDRTHINKDIKWYQVDANFNIDHVFNYDDISASIDHWKNILVEQANVGPGSIVVSSLTQRDLRWITLLFAIWELGASYNLQHPKFRGVNSPFTAAVVDDEDSAAEQKLYTNCIIRLDVWDNYVSSGSASNQIPTVFSSDLPIIKASTVSIDLEPESVEFSHAFSHEVSNRCANIFGFKADDRMMHMHGSHHNAALTDVVLPSLNVCKNHYGVLCEYDKLVQIAELVERENITKISMPNSLATERFLQQANRFTKPVGIISNQGNQSNWIELMKEKNVASIVSDFGCLKMSGPIFINTLTQDSDHLHNCMNFGFPLDDFYKVKLVNGNQIQVENKYQGTMIFPDEFELTDTGYVFKHRNSTLRINDVILSASELNNIVEKIVDTSLVCLLPDPTMNRVYLLVDHSIELLKEVVDAINTEIVNNISPLVQINYVDQVDASFYKQNEQFNEFQVRNHFRTKFKLR